MDVKVDLEITQQKGIAVAAFKTPLISNTEGINNVKKQIKEWISKNHTNRMVFDFECVKFFSSQVLGLLLDVRAELQKCHGQVFISAINPQLHRIFKITRLDKIFMFFPDKESAIKAMSTD